MAMFITNCFPSSRAEANSSMEAKISPGTIEDNDEFSFHTLNNIFDSKKKEKKEWQKDEDRERWKE